jgi:hypothetical protein
MAFSTFYPCRLLWMSKEALGMAPPPSAPMVRVSSVVLNTGLAPRGLPSPKDSSGIVASSFGVPAFAYL